MQRITMVATALTLCAASTVVGQEMKKIKPMKQATQESTASTLTIGDKAPAIDIAHWVKGDKIDEFESGKVYVVEFWATWCGPCIASMPHLSALQEKYTDYDVKFISVSDEPLQTVVSFLFNEYKGDGKIHNDRTQYTLTTDPDESVKNAYFRAAGQTGIPSAFIIGKDTTIEWIGHPMSMDDPLEAVVKDTWEREPFKVKFEKDMADRRFSLEKRRAIQAAVASKDWEGAITAIDELTASSDAYLGFNTQKFQILTRELKDYDRASALVPAMFEKSWDSANALNNLTWFMVDEAGIEHFDAALVLKASKRSNELTEHKNAAYLDTLARIYYETGDLKSALKWQRQAAENVQGDGPMSEGILKALRKYESEVGSDA